MNDKVYYVYVHVVPHQSEVMYVGKGCYGRAWDVTRNRGQHPKHLSWMKGLVDCGYLPHDWVKIIRQNLTEEEAFRVEKEYLHLNGPTAFNRTTGERNHQSKLTDKQAQEIFIRSKTELHKDLAKEFNISRSAVSMIATRKQWRTATACLVQ